MRGRWKLTKILPVHFISVPKYVKLLCSWFRIWNKLLCHWALWYQIQRCIKYLCWCSVDPLSILCKEYLRSSSCFARLCRDLMLHNGTQKMAMWSELLLIGYYLTTIHKIMPAQKSPLSMEIPPTVISNLQRMDTREPLNSLQLLFVMM